MISLKNIGQRLLDSTTLDEKVGNFFRPKTGTLASTGRKWAQELAAKPAPSWIPQQVQQTAQNISDRGGFNRLKQEFTSNPAQFTPLSMKSAAVDTGRKLGSEDLGYGLRGALSLTPFQSAGKLTPKLSAIQQTTAPTTGRQQAAQSIGQTLYGTALTAPLSTGKTVLKSVGNVARNLAVGGTTGALMQGGSDLLTGNFSKDSLKQGALSGLQNSWVLPVTNSLTDAAILKLFPKAGLKITGAGVTDPFKLGKIKEGFGRLLTQSLAQVPAENTAFTFLNQLDDKTKGSFTENWMNNLPGNIVGNILSAGVSGSVNVFSNPQSRKVVTDAMKKTVDEWNTPVTMMGGEKMPMWKYKMMYETKPGFARLDLGVGKDTPKLSVEPVGGKVVAQGGLGDMATKPNAFQDILPSKSKPEAVKNIVKGGGNPLYHDTNADGVMGILNSGEIRPNQAPLSSLAGQGKRVSTTRNFDNYSRYHNSPYRFIIDEAKTGQKSIPDNRAEFESIFQKPVKLNSVGAIGIDTTNPAILQDIKSGKLESVLSKAKERGISIQLFEGKVLPDKFSNRELQQITKTEVSNLVNKSPSQGGLSDVKPTIKGVTKSQVQEPSPKLALSQETTQMPGTETLSSPKLALPQGDYTLKQPVGKTTSEYNIGRIKTTNQKAVSDAIKQEAPAFEKVLGEKLTHKEIIDQANEFSDTVLQTIGRKTTEELGAAQLRNRQNIARLADSGEVTPELLTAMKTDSSFARSTAQLLGQRAIDANPQTPLGKNLMKYVKAANEVADNIDLVYEKSKGVDFNNKEAASAFYRQFVKPTIGDWLDKVRYSSMLSSPNTVINNASSNLQGTGLLAPIEKTVTGGIDAIVSGLTGSQRKNFAGEGVEYAKGYFSSLKPALQNFADAMKGGSDASEMFDVPLTQPGTGARTAENALAFFPRLAQATDELFSTMTRSGLEKANTYKTAKGGVSQTADQMALETKRRLFNQPFGTDQSYVLNMLEYIPSKVMEATHSKNPFMKWTAKFIFPFVRIPANVFKAGVEYSPLGFSTLPGANNKTEQASKALMGTAVALGAWSLANSDRLTFGMPTSEKQRDAFTAAGLQPYSVKIGDKWIGYTKFHPIIGFNMALASAFKEALDKKTVSDDQLDTVVTVAGKWLTYFANQSYVKQMGDFMSLSAGNESAIGKAIGNYPSQLIPYRAFMGWLARAFDPNERKIDPDGSKLDKSLQSIMMSIPGLRNTLQPRLDSNGQPVKQQNRFLNLVSPGKVTSEVPQQKFVYDTIKAKSLQTSKDNAIKDQLRKSANGEVAQLGADRYAWFDPDKAEVVTVDISKPIEEPKFTGQTEVDKKLVSAYKGKITSRINDIVKLVEAGKIEPAKAEEMIKTLKATQSKLSGGKKPKKITIKTTKAPRVSFKLAKPTKMSVIKAPTSKRARISFKNYKPAKIKV